MANYRALALDPTGMGNLEIKDADTLQIGNVVPSSGNLTIGGAAGSNVVVTNNQTLSVSGATGGINLTGGADLLAAAGSTLQGFDSIEGITSSNLVDKSASETITGQWTFQSSNIINPKLIVKAAGGEAANSLLFQVQDSLGANLFSVDVEGDVNIAGGETVAGTTIYTGNVTLGDGGNTIQLGSAAAPAVGDNVYINTTGTADGSFSVTTANFNITTAGLIDTNGNVIVVNADAAVGTNEYSANVWLDGDGAANIEGWRVRNDGGTQGFAIQHKQNPVNPFNLAEAGWASILTATPTGVTIVGSLTATTLSGTFTGTISTCGTSCNAWEINNDAAALTAEDTGVMFPAGDGANVQNFQFFNDSSAKQMILRYKQDPTDPADMAEGGYTNIGYFASTQQAVLYGNLDVQNGLDVTGAALTAPSADIAGGIDLNGTLSFDGIAASTIDTSGNNPLTINVGASTISTTASVVDLRTNTTALDVPSGTGFRIGGTAITTANFTAPNVDILLNGSNADALHTHAAGTTGKVSVSSINTSAMTQYYAGYISANNTASNTDCSAGSGSYTTSSFAGVCEAAPAVGGALVTNGKVTVQFEAGIVPAPAAGEPALLSRSVAGRFINTAVGAPNNSYVVRVGTILDASNYGVNQRCDIIIYPGHPVKK